MAGGVRGRGHVWQGGVWQGTCMAVERAWHGGMRGRGDMCGRGHAWQGGVHSGVVHGRGACVADTTRYG